MMHVEKCEVDDLSGQWGMTSHAVNTHLSGPKLRHVTADM